MKERIVKKPRFWTKVIAGLAGALIASGQIPEVLLPLLSEGVYQALGGVVATIMAGWVGKDKMQVRKQTKAKKDLLGLLVLLPILLLASCTMASYKSPDGTEISLTKVFSWQGFEGFEAKNLASDPEISIKKQETQGVTLQELLKVLGALR